MTRQFNIDVIPAEIASSNIAQRASQLTAEIIHIGHGANQPDSPYVKGAHENIRDIRTYLAIIEDVLAKVTT